MNLYTYQSGGVSRKTQEQLEYENQILMKQLYERDEIIAMFKSKWSPESLPINQELVKKLNLQIANKNVLI